MRCVSYLSPMLWLMLPFAANAVEVVVHRGDNGHAPENTIAAAERCIKLGVDYLEFDVRRSKDGVHYILHDATLDRTTDGTGPIRNLTSEQIDKLDAGSWFAPEFAGERVPRLETLLDACKGRIKLYFDVKDADIPFLIELIQKRGLQHDSFLWFGDPRMARQFRDLNKDLQLKVNADTAEGVQRAKAELQANLIECAARSLTPEFIKTCRDLGMRIMVREGNPDEAAFRRTVEAGADLINLDHPELFLRVQSEVLSGSK